MTTRFATVALVGRPNVGKSTLLNTLVGTGLSAVSPKAQTTRQQVIGVWTDDITQLVLLDTPGQAPAKDQTLNKLLDRNAVSALADVDIVVWVREAGKSLPADDIVARRIVDRSPAHLVIALNKVDRITDKARLIPELTRLQEQYSPEILFPLSARRAADGARLCRALTPLAEAGEWPYPGDMLTPQKGEFLVAEKIREQLFHLLHEELPYRMAVTVDSLDDVDGTNVSHATIWLDRASHKPIVLGRQGRNLATIRTQAEGALRQLWQRPFRLHLWVKLREGWAEDQAVIRTLGSAD